MKKHSLSLIMIITILLVFVLDITGPIHVFSAFENRYLATRPLATVDTILSNQFSLSFEAYVNDQFVGRDYWISLKSIFEKITNKKENNGIYFGKDNFLFEKMVVASDQLKLNDQYMYEFLALYPNLPISIMIPLSSAMVYKDMLPSYAPMFNQKEWLNSHEGAWPLINITPLLESSKDQVYYRNDHHWTLEGAYLAYTKIAEEFEFIPSTWESFDVKTASDFLGTYYAKGKPLTFKSDTLKFIDSPIISYKASGMVYDSLIDESKLEGYDKYSSFLHGNHGYATIKVNEVNQPKRLLLIKDSYANSLVPFLVGHYDEIEIVDLRHFFGSLKSIIQSKTYDNILFLHSFSQFSSDATIAKLRY